MASWWALLALAVVTIHLACRWLVERFVLRPQDTTQPQPAANADPGAAQLPQPASHTSAQLAPLPPQPPQRQSQPDILLLPRHFPPNMPVEQCNWVNTLIRSLFQRMQSKDMSERWCRNLNKEFEQLEEKSKILSYIYASHLDVGHSPPEIKFIQIRPTDATRKDLVLQAKFIYFGGFSMELHTQIQLYSVVDAHVKVTVLDCTGDMLLRVDAGGGVEDSQDQVDVTMCLAGDPTFNLEIKSVVGSYSDLSMLKQIIAGTFKLVFRKMFVTPNSKRYRWSAPRLDPATGLVVKGWRPVAIDIAEKKATAERSKKKKSGSTTTPAVGRLFITLRSARGVKAGDASGLVANPYCITSFNRQNRKSKVVSRTTDPVWNEKYVFDVFDASDNVVFSVYNRDRLGKDNFCGHFKAAVDISQPTRQHTNDREGILSVKGTKESSGGTILVNISYEPFTDTVIGGVHTVVYNKDLPLSQFDNSFIELLAKKPRPASFISETYTMNVDDVVPPIVLDSITTDNRSSVVSIDAGSLSPTAGRKSRPLSTLSIGSASNESLSMAMLTAENDARCLDQEAPASTYGSMTELAVDTSPGANSPLSPHLNSPNSTVPRYTITVTVHQARGLVASDSTGFSDPYCTATIGKATKKTRIVKKSLSPIWNEDLQFQVVSVPSEIVFEVHSWNRFAQHKFLGQARVPATPQMLTTLDDSLMDQQQREQQVMQGNARSYELGQRTIPLSTDTPSGSSSLVLDTVTGQLEVSVEVVPILFSQPLSSNSNVSNDNSTNKIRITTNDGLDSGAIKMEMDASHRPKPEADQLDQAQGLTPPQSAAVEPHYVDAPQLKSLDAFLAQPLAVPTISSADIDQEFASHGGVDAHAGDPLGTHHPPQHTAESLAAQRAAIIQHRAVAATAATKEMAKNLASNLSNRWKSRRGNQ